MLYMKVIKRVDSVFPSQRKHFFFSFYFISIWINGCSLNLLWSAFPKLYNFNHYPQTYITVCQMYLNKTGKEISKSKMSNIKEMDLFYNLSFYKYFSLSKSSMKILLTCTLLSKMLTLSPRVLTWASLVVQRVKNLPAMQETRVWFLGGGDPLEKGMATHSSVLAQRISWM